jgi:hypothetical protein
MERSVIFYSSNDAQHFISHCSSVNEVSLTSFKPLCDKYIIVFNGPNFNGNDSRLFKQFAQNAIKFIQDHNHVQTDIGLNRVELLTTSGDHRVWSTSEDH